MVITEGSGGALNAPPIISKITVGDVTETTFSISYTVTDADLQIVRHFLILNGERTEISDDVGYNKESFTYVKSGLDKGTPYSVQIAVTDGLYETMSESALIETLEKTLIGYTIQEDTADPSDRVKYTDAAVGQTPGTYTDYKGFAKLFPFKYIKIVGLKNGLETGEINPNDKTKYLDGQPVPEDVDVMVRFPKTFWKVSKSGTVVTNKLSSQNEGGFVSNAFKFSGQEKNYLYIGVYPASLIDGKLRSVRGKTVFTEGDRGNCGTFITNCINYAKANGNGYIPFNHFSISYLAMLHVLLTKSTTSAPSNMFGLENVFTYGIPIIGMRCERESTYYVNVKVSSDNGSLQSYNSQVIAKYISSANYYITAKVTAANICPFFPAEEFAASTAEYYCGQTGNSDYDNNFCVWVAIGNNGFWDVYYDARGPQCAPYATRLVYIGNGV